MVNAPTMIEKQNVIQIKILIGARTHLNYYIKKNNYTYTKEFDKLRKEQNLAGHLRENSIIMCQMIFTSDQEFFDRIGEQETKDILMNVINLSAITKILEKKILYLQLSI